MKITGIELNGVHVNHRGDWVFVHVFTNSGIQGLGELRAGKKYHAQVQAVRALGEELIGKDPRCIEAIIARYTDTDRNKTELYALSAIEQALWDILGKSLGAPVHRLLGGACHEKIRLYANINRATTERTPANFATNAAAAVADGFDAVKLAPFDGLPVVDSTAEAAQGIACMEAVREAIGPDIDLLVDCHSRFTVKGALEVAAVLRPLQLFWFEQPTAEINLTNCLAVKDQCGLTVAGGEQRGRRQDWMEVVMHASMDIVMPDVTDVGGIAELKKIGDMLQVWNIPTAPHGPFGPVVLAASVHAMASLPSFLIQEYAWGEVPWRQDLTLPREQIINGYIPINERPGLGVELNLELIREHKITL